MASCSLYQPVSYPLLSRSELDSILLFERVVGDWVREVHMFTSKRKSGSNFVIFRNSNNTRIRGIEEFRFYLALNGFDASFLETKVFKSDKEDNIVSNKIGANVEAKKDAFMWVEDVKNNKIEKMIPKCTIKQEFYKEHLRYKSNKNSPTKATEEKETIITKENKSVSMISSIQFEKEKNKDVSEFMKCPANLVKKEANDGLAQFENNENKFWIGDKLDMMIDGDISEEEDKTLDQSLTIVNGIESNAESKSKKINKLNLGSIDYSWMESFGCDSDHEGEQCVNVEEESNKTLELGPIDCSWMESQGDLSDSDDDKVLENDAKEGCKKGKQLEMSSIDYSWMDSMGCVSEIEEDESLMKNCPTSIQNNSENIDCIKQCIDLSLIENNDIKDVKEKNREETETKNVDDENNTKLESRKSSQNSSFEDNAKQVISEANKKCIPWILRNTELKEEMLHMSNKTNLIESENEQIYKEKTSEILEEKLERKKENSEIVDVGDFCAAWMDCFESITELDSNLKVKLEDIADNTLMNEVTSEKYDEIDPESSSFLFDKKSKDDFNHKIAKACSDSSRNTIEERENEMFKLLEDVLFKSDMEEDIKSNDVDKQEIDLLDTTLSCEIKDNKKDERELDLKTSTILKFGDAENIRWEFKEDLETLPKQISQNNRYDTTKCEDKITNFEKNGFLKEIESSPTESAHSHLKFSNINNDAGFASNNNDYEGIINEVRSTTPVQDVKEQICPVNSNFVVKTSSPKTLLEDSDSSYMDDEGKISVARVRNKKMKRRKLLKGKLKRDDNKMKKSSEMKNLCRKTILNVRTEKAAETEGKEITKSDVQSAQENEPSNEIFKHDDKSGPSPSEYSSNWETDDDDDEDDIPPQSSDNMEDV